MPVAAPSSTRADSRSRAASAAPVDRPARPAQERGRPALVVGQRLVVAGCLVTASDDPARDAFDELADRLVGQLLCVLGREDEQAVSVALREHVAIVRHEHLERARFGVAALPRCGDEHLCSPRCAGRARKQLERVMHAGLIANPADDTEVIVVAVTLVVVGGSTS